jgi:hypothetical protein
MFALSSPPEMYLFNRLTFPSLCSLISAIVIMPHCITLHGRSNLCNPFLSRAVGDRKIYYGFWKINFEINKHNVRFA